MLTIGQIIGYVTQLTIDWGLMPFIQAGLLVTVVVGTFVAVRRLMQGA